MIKAQVSTPTASSTVHEVTHSPVMPSVWFVAPSEPAGKKPRCCSGVQPAKSNAAESATGAATHFIRRLERTAYLSKCFVPPGMQAKLITPC
ncbi:hypothetical protein GCM10009805_27670 [Leucobacter chromiireducens subsp. solipictus]